MIKKIRILKDQKRAQTKKELFKEYLPSHSKIIDIGTGSGQFSLVLKEDGHQITSVDIKDKTNTNFITPTVYDGEKLPFENNSFDISMLITVLHHCPNPEKVFQEAVRVSKSRIFVLEDVYSNFVMKYLTWWMDSLMNLEFFGHPHTNKSEAAWEDLFKDNKLGVIYKKKVKVLGIFNQVAYVLEKKI
ncbi:MAG: class I SAM-dependent methyltransferase [Flavobacteriaceae bacterium]|nr:class I SAM-dependent methyltransferase [Flavobacteriaceae bacterium]